MIVHTKCKLNNAELFLELVYIQVIQSKEIQNREVPQRKQTFKITWKLAKA